MNNFSECSYRKSKNLKTTKKKWYDYLLQFIVPQLSPSVLYLCFQTGEGLDNFWKVLVDGRNCSVPIPKERFDLTSWYDPDDSKPGKSRTAKAALIDGYVL